MSKIYGSCLCGVVKFRFSEDIKDFRYCFCSRCQKATGSAHASNILINADAFTFDAGQEGLASYKLPDAERFEVCFCQTCGTRMPHFIKSLNVYLVPAGTLDNQTTLKPSSSIFCDDKPCWYELPGSLPQYKAYVEK